jgi:ABC-type lipoprotein export system ATPase subunit
MHNVVEVYRMHFTRKQGPPGSGSSTLLASLTSANGHGITGQMAFEGLTKFDRRTMSFVPKVSERIVLL